MYVHIVPGRTTWISQTSWEQHGTGTGVCTSPNCQKQVQACNFIICNCLTDWTVRRRKPSCTQIG